MYVLDEATNKGLVSPVREIEGELQLHASGSLVWTTGKGSIISFKIERVGEDGKFFGFGICQKATVVLENIHQWIPPIKKGNNFTLRLGYKQELKYFTFPQFYVDTWTYSNQEGTLTIVGYDKLYSASTATLKDLNLKPPYTIADVAKAIAKYLYGKEGYCDFSVPNMDQFNLNYPTGANFSKDQTETLREILDAIAEATQTIYCIETYASMAEQLVFKSLKQAKLNKFITSPDNTLSSNYGKQFTLTEIASVTELGDNVSAKITTKPKYTPYIQYIRENPFLTLRDDIGQILDRAIANIGNTDVIELDCEWRGNYALMVGEGFGFQERKNKDGTPGPVREICPLTNDVLTYDGSLSQHTQWKAVQDDAETATNPSTLGEKLNQTYARVDKANQKIELAVKDIEGNKEAITGITVEQGKISSSVSDLNGEYNKITQTLEGVVYDNGKGTTVINGDNITTGTIQADRINLSKSITFGDCSDDLQATITASNVPGYITATKITETTIESPTITGNAVIGTEVIAKEAFKIQDPKDDKITYGYMGKGSGSLPNGTNTTGIVLSAGSAENLQYGTPFLIVTNAGVRMTAGSNSLYVTSNGCYAENNKISKKLDGSGGGGEVVVHAVWGA